MLHRTLEPEVMDSEAEALQYDSMDHAEVNARFVADLQLTWANLDDVLDLGTGTAQIPMALCRVVAEARVIAVDAARHMLRLGREHLHQNGLLERVHLVCGDAKHLPCATGRFTTVISNSIVHHIPEPRAVLAEAVRVCRAGGTLFFRDLMRPDNQATVQQLVATYAAGANAPQRQMFADSLRAALSLTEIRRLVTELGFSAEAVQATSDRHWTWTARSPV